MIAKLKGKIDTLKPTEAIIDVQGVGYYVHIPFVTYEEIQDLKETTLFIHTFHKEEHLKLFGFHNEKLRDIFLILLNVNGIGPSMAISILSGISIDSLVDSVRKENTTSLVKIPGIGKNKAEKLIFELKRKIEKLSLYASPEENDEDNESHVKNETVAINNDAVEALVSLGFDEKKSKIVITEITREQNEITIEKLIKEALKRL